MAKQTLDFKKVASMPSSLSKGTIYFDNSDHLIKVATGTSTYTTFAGVQSAAWNSSTNTLIITNHDGRDVVIDFSSCITETELDVILNQLREGIGFPANTNSFGSTGIADTSYLNTADSSTVIGALKTLDAQLHAVESAAGVVSIGGESGVITLKGDGNSNGDVNLTMNGKQLQAAIVGLGTAAYTNSSAYDPSGAAAAVLGTSGDSSVTKTVYGLDAKIDAIKTDSSISLTEAAGSGDVLKVYTITQGSTTVGTINIPKDFLVKSGDVKTVTTDDQPYSGAKVGDKYLDFVVNAKEGAVTDSHIYIPVKDLTDVYTGGGTGTIKVDVGDNNEITAEIIEGSISTEYLDSSVVASLDKADTAVQSVTSSDNSLRDISPYVQVEVDASRNGNDVTLSSRATLVTKDVSIATSSSDGLAMAYDVQQYVQTYVTDAMQWSEFVD